MRPTSLSFPITKATPQADGRLLVEGTATSDSIDSQDERLLFDGSVEALSKWLETGPAVRESHDPHKAVGRGLEMIADPARKAIDVRVFVSSGAQDTQAKVLDGTLAAFSVGGQPKVWQMKKEGKKNIREISAWDMHELSLVDRPANPDCRIDVIKADQLTDVVGRGEEMAKKEEKPAPDAESEPKDKPAPGDKPAEPNPPKGEEKPVPEEGKEPPAEEKEDAPVEAAAPAVEPKKFASAKEAEEALKADVEACMKEEADFAASLAQKRAAIAAAAAGFNLGEIVPKEWAAKPEKKAKKGDGSPEMQKDDSAAWDVQMALDCLRGMQALLSLESGEMENKPEQVTLLTNAIQALKAFIVSEAAELLEGEPAAAPAAAPVEEVAAVAASAAPDWTKSIDTKFAEVATAIAAVKTDPELVGKVGEILKAVGEVKALKSDLGSISERIDVLLSQPVPGGPRKMFTPGMAKAASGMSATDRVKWAEEALAAAPAGEAQAFLSVELARAKAAAGI